MRCRIVLLITSARRPTHTRVIFRGIFYTAQESRRVAGSEAEAVHSILDQFIQRAESRGNHRRSTGKRLDDGHREAFIPKRRNNQESGLLQKLQYLRARTLAEVLDSPPSL